MTDAELQAKATIAAALIQSRGVDPEGLASSNKDARRLIAQGHAVTVFHRGQTHADLPDGVGHLLGDRDRLAEHANELRQLRPQVVIDMIAYVEAHAVSLLEVFHGWENDSRYVIGSGNNSDDELDPLASNANNHGALDDLFADVDDLLAS